MTTLLDVRGLRKHYGPFTALNGVDLSIAPGEFHGLIGPNGSGKSTLLKCLAGAEIPSSGTVAFDGVDVSTLPPARRARRGISLKFQITSVLPQLSAYENVQLAAQAHAGFFQLLLSQVRHDTAVTVEQLLNQFRLADVADTPVAELSHGHQQWLEIAMALAIRPRLLILDEPTSGMSVEERRVTGELLSSLKRDGCSLLIVEHDLEFIRDLCHAITVLDQGEVVATGSVSEIQANQKVREAYLG
ncbi:ABC transporter family protein [Paraburkholderia xenovorans LB400]|uniref:Amino acid/amide ABC transporter ATP-binding protein 1, HAAT family n=1 Tax=Paraburkholderia xenovorans (strain LB400) TaxID=266265 RepID=Q13FM6_PARXL|nr:ABC transporter ATP-binding protein [Paraburkholderia xenovorans]ABE37113.1 amino acid/amide ABC transporter ATP-binding protein 1, HAAT family [Paraburkholderia xenovorans LB400]AIP34472.1 ABC transporter family protein [Paraburkholderia xenovorans LB400]